MHQFPLLNVEAEYADLVVDETKKFLHLVEENVLLSSEKENLEYSPL